MYRKQYFLKVITYEEFLIPEILDLKHGTYSVGWCSYNETINSGEQYQYKPCYLRIISTKTHKL